MDSIEETLQQRSIYGSFKEKAEWIQDAKEASRDTPAWCNDQLSNAEQEAIDNILQKLGRILFRSEYHEDSWHDIAGYATLIVKGD